MRQRRGESGQSMVEFALLVPLMLLLICGIIDFGRVMYAYMNLNMAAKEAVRQGGLGQSDAVIRSFTYDFLRPIDPSRISITISPDDSVRKSGDYVTVTLDESINYITPMMSGILPSPYHVVTDSTIRVE